MLVPRKVLSIPEKHMKHESTAGPVILESIVQLTRQDCFVFIKSFFEPTLALFASVFVRSRGKKHSVILRTQLTVRVHACIGECWGDMFMCVFNVNFSLDSSVSQTHP